MKKTLVFMNFFLILAALFHSPARIEEDTQSTALAVTSVSDIKIELEAYIESHQHPPIEPRLDKIYQFIPGIDGIEIDFELSYQNMLNYGQFNPELIAYTPIPTESDSANFKAHRLYKGNEKSPYVGLLINVAWGEAELKKMLEILDDHNVSASLFFEGKFAKKHPELVKDAANRGHIVGNHSYSHPANWLSLSYEGFKEEIVRTNHILTDILGEEIVFFAPPGGAFNDDTVRAAYDQGMYTILWSADSIDWRGENARVLHDRVMRRLDPGGLILTHPKPETVKALPEIIDSVRERGLEFATIEQIVSGRR